MVCHVKTHKLAHLPPSAAICRRTADKNITGPIRQLNSRHSIPQASLQGSQSDWTTGGLQTTEELDNQDTGGATAQTGL